MNYKHIYEKLIQNRLENPADGYTEKHHIKPKCLGGSDNKKNLVALTAREHFECHYYLTEMYEKGTDEWYKMIHAFMMMNNKSASQNRYFDAKIYEEKRKYFSEAMSKLKKGKFTGKKNSQYGTMWISNNDLKQNKKIKKNDSIPEGWLKGKNLWNRQKECVICGKIFYAKRKTCSDECMRIFFSDNMKKYRKRGSIMEQVRLGSVR